MQRQYDYFPALDALRGVAALLVVQMHYKQWFGGVYLQHAYLAVDFFFLLSGFVVAHAYGQKLAQGALSFTGFALARAARLYPMYLLALILTVWLSVLKTGYADPVAIVLALFMLPLLTNPDPRWFVANSWTLSFEYIVNFVYAYLHKDLTARVLLVFLAITFGLLAYTAHHFGSLDAGFRFTSLIGGFARAGFSFSLGILLYTSRTWTKLPSSAWLSLLSIIALPLLLWVPVPKDWRGLYEVSVVVLALPIVLLAAAASRSSLGLAHVYFWIGAMSYPLYILHGVAMGLFDFWVGDAVADPQRPIVASIFIVGLVGICAILDWALDRPLRRVLTRAFRSTTRGYVSG
jgi:peptidoglycan/LPS O-acetylase OafA/YrhL